MINAQNQNEPRLSGQSLLKPCQKFTFTELDVPHSHLTSKSTEELLYKWGMSGNIYMKKFAYDQYVQEYQIEKFLTDFLNLNPSVKVLTSGDRWGTLGRVEKVEFIQLETLVTSMEFFDRVNSVTRSNGEIKKCLDEYYESFIVSDELRKLLLIPTDENYDLFSLEDRKELIFNLFKHFSLGGKVCQFEDYLNEYLNVTKQVYKDLVSVVKKDSKVVVDSLVYKILKVKSSVSDLFPIEHEQNFCFVIIDMVSRTLCVLYHAQDDYY